MLGDTLLAVGDVEGLNWACRVQGKSLDPCLLSLALDFVSVWFYGARDLIQGQTHAQQVLSHIPDPEIWFYFSIVLFLLGGEGGGHTSQSLGSIPASLLRSHSSNVQGTVFVVADSNWSLQDAKQEPYALTPTLNLGFKPVLGNQALCALRVLV